MIDEVLTPHENTDHINSEVDTNDAEDDEPIPDQVSSNNEDDVIAGNEVNVEPDNETIEDNSDFDDNDIDTGTEVPTNEELDKMSEAVDETKVCEETTHETDGNDEITDKNEPSHRYNLRERGSVNYKTMHRYGEAQLLQIQKQLSRTDKYAQVSVTEGIKRHGDKAIQAVLSEFPQLNDKNVFRPK